MPDDTGQSTGADAAARDGSAAAADRGAATVGDGNITITGDVQGGVTIVQSGAPATGAVPQPSAPPEPSGYDLAVVRDLLLAAFTAADLRRLFLYTAVTELRPLTQEFSPNDGVAAMVDKTVAFCLARRLLPELLQEVKRANPRQYDHYAQQLRA